MLAARLPFRANGIREENRGPNRDEQQHSKTGRPPLQAGLVASTGENHDLTASELAVWSIRVSAIAQTSDDRGAGLLSGPALGGFAVVRLEHHAREQSHAHILIRRAGTYVRREAPLCPVQSRRGRSKIREEVQHPVFAQED